MRRDHAGEAWKSWMEFEGNVNDLGSGRNAGMEEKEK